MVVVIDKDVYMYSISCPERAKKEVQRGSREVNCRGALFGSEMASNGIFWVIME